MYPEAIVNPMKVELTDSGFNQLLNSDFFQNHLLHCDFHIKIKDANLA